MNKRMHCKTLLLRLVRDFPPVFVGLCLLASGCASKKPHEPPLAHVMGKISGNEYTSPRGRFSVPCPVDPDLEGRVLRDDATGVTFVDRIGSKVTFNSLQIRPGSSMMNMLSTRGREEALNTFLRDDYGNLIVPHYHPEVLGGTSAFVFIKSGPTRMGVAATVHDERIYLVETDLPPGVELLQNTSDERLETNAMNLLQTLQFK